MQNLSDAELESMSGGGLTCVFCGRPWGLYTRKQYGCVEPGPDDPRHLSGVPLVFDPNADTSVKPSPLRPSRRARARRADSMA